MRRGDRLCVESRLELGCGEVLSEEPQGRLYMRQVDVRYAVSDPQGLISRRGAIEQRIAGLSWRQGVVG